MAKKKEQLIKAFILSPLLPELIEWPDPTPKMLHTPEFSAVWNCIKSWDVNVPEAYHGYCGATGNHVRAILDALQPYLRTPHPASRAAG